MSLNVYWLILLIVDGLLLFLGLHLIFGSIPTELKIRSYLSSRKCIGCAIAVSPLAGFIYYIYKLKGSSELFEATAVNLTANFLTTIFVALSFVYIINYKLELQKIRCTLLIVAALLFLLPVWLPIILNMDSSSIFFWHVVASIILTLFVGLSLVYMFLTYKKVLANIDNYYSSDVALHIQWIMKSIYFLIGLGIIACISPFSNHYPLELTSFYLLYQTAVYCYVYESFIRFETSTMLSSYNYSIIDCESEIQKDPPYEPLSEEVVRYIEKELKQWVKQRKYQNPGITINGVASDIYTNRTYLSIYINNYCNCTFKIWISQLRIDESKRMLCDNEEYSAVQIAKKLGFVSTESYTRQFKRLEGVSPTVWRAIHKRSLYKAV